jgi:hypothetical protein
MKARRCNPISVTVIYDPHDLSITVAYPITKNDEFLVNFAKVVNINRIGDTSLHD